MLHLLREIVLTNGNPSWVWHDFPQFPPDAKGIMEGLVGKF